MIYCIRCVNIQECHKKVAAFIVSSERTNSKYVIKEIRRHRNYPVITLTDGSEIHFVTIITYRSWCKGKTYKFFGDDHVYRNGHILNISETSY